MKKVTAFTLIELLIVVAIIGILAAIAVPNFLNAQMRAKLARVESDMKAIATSIEMYSMDNSRAPIGSLEGISLGVWEHGLRHALNQLTTPTSYMGSIPLDPFMIQAGQTRDSDTNRSQYTYNCMQNAEWRGGNYQKAYDKGFHWYFFSPGPANTQAAPWPDYLIADYPEQYQNNLRVYEASNGLVSEGWIIRTNKGMFP